VQSSSVWNVAGLIYLLAFAPSFLNASQTDPVSVPEDPYCSKEVVNQLCAPAVEGDSNIELSCSIDFSKYDCQSLGFSENVITKKVLFSGSSASGVSVNFNGATINAGPGSYHYQRRDIIEIRSVLLGSGEWSVPENVTILNALVYGSIRIYGMGPNSESSLVKQSSRKEDHPQKVRSAAPSLAPVCITQLSLAQS